MHGNSLIPCPADHDRHYANRMRRGEISFGPLTIAFDTPEDGDGDSDILSLHVDDATTDQETAICKGIEAMLEALEADWTQLIHAKLNP